MAFWNKFLGSRAEHTDDPIESIREAVVSGSAIMLDVRSQTERDAGFIKDSVFINFEWVQSLTEDSEHVMLLSKEKVIYCH